jgi:hypothetical protein
MIANKLIHIIRHVYSDTNVTTGAYVELDAVLSGDVKALEVFDSSGETMLFAYGAAGSEEDSFQIMPGGNGRIPFLMSKGVRLAVKAISGTASTGELTINLWG